MPKHTFIFDPLPVFFITNAGVTMYLLGLILWAVIWVAIAFWPARVAGKKGHSFLGFFC